MKSDAGTYDNHASKVITLSTIRQIFENLGVSTIYVKKLAPNDNSKNQPFMGCHLTDLSFIPTGEVVASNSASQKTAKDKVKFQAPLDFYWVNSNGEKLVAPKAQLIYYPQYPEVRLSGFLAGSKVNISRWMSPEKDGRSLGRWLLLGVTKEKSICAYLATPESCLAKELAHANYIEISKVFWQLAPGADAPIKSPRQLLEEKLLEIHMMQWVAGQKFHSGIGPVPYKAANGGGYTLESLLEISPNGVADPDYLGWEVKQFAVSKFPRKGAKPSTLMTPEPNGGFYKEIGAVEFVRAFGYPDKNGKPDRINFGGVHIANKPHKLTGLTLKLIGFDPITSSITDANGAIALIDEIGNVTACWTFAKLMDHWKRKHSQAVYIPCIRRIHLGEYQYLFGKDIELGIGTDFERFLAAMVSGSIYYDPGIKLEDASTELPKLKRRSQFRVDHKDLPSLYDQFEFIDLHRQ